AELQIVRNSVGIAAKMRPGLERAHTAGRQRARGCVIEKDRLAGGGPRKLLSAQRLDVVAHCSTGRIASGPGMDTRTVRGSSASRSASPSRLKPRTAAPIARPGNTDVHGACRSW